MALVGIEGIRKHYRDLAESGVNGVICMETALGFYGIGSFSSYAYCIMQSKENIPFAQKTIIVDTLDLRNTESVVGGIYITRPERAICDIISDNGDLFHLLEAIDDCFNYDNCIPDGFDRELCLKLVEEYGIEDRFNELLEESKTIYDE